MEMSTTNLQIQDSFLNELVERSRYSAPQIYKYVGWNRQQWNYFKKNPQTIKLEKLKLLLEASAIDRRTFYSLVFK